MISERITCLNYASFLEARRSGLGSSDAAAILGASPFASPLDVYLAKLGLAESEQTEAMRFGQLLEPIVIAEYERETGRTLAPIQPFTIVQSDEAPWLRATLDGEIIQADGHDGPAP